MFEREFWTYTKTVRVASVFKYSNQYNTTYAATKAIDGDIGTYWQTRSPTGAYIVLELGEPSAVTNMRWYVADRTYIATSFTVAGSNDGETFNDLFTGACERTSGWQEFEWANETAYKYIRVTCNSAYSTRLYTHELEFGVVEKQHYEQPYGKYIVAVFDGPVSAPAESDASHFSVTAPIAVMGEDGYLKTEPTSRAITSVVAHPDVANALLITLDTTQRIDECWKPVTLAYDGTGSLTGNGRPVEAFEVEFEPQGIAYKGDQVDAEHIEIASINPTGILIRLSYRDVSSGTEHIEIAGINATGILTHVNDI